MKKLMRTLLLSITGLVILVFISGCTDNQNEATTNGTSGTSSVLDQEDTLIVYYSLTNNTHEMAEQISSLSNVNLTRLDAAEAYPEDNNSAINDRIAEQQANNQFDELTGVPEDLSSYSTILVGFPIWSDDIAYPIQSFLAQNADELAGKTIIPFSTSSVVDDDVIAGIQTHLTDLVPDAVILPGLHLTASNVDEDTIEEWLSSISFDEGEAEENTPINVQIGNTSFAGFINDSVPGQDFLSHLPENLTFSTFMEGYPEKVAELDYVLNTNGMPGDTPISGAIDYNSNNQSLFVYYGEVGTYDELHRIGQITDPAFEEFMSEQEEDFTMEITLAD